MHDPHDTETTLVEIATLTSHIELALRHAMNGDRDLTILEMRNALVCAHKIKLYAMALRWMAAPRTFSQLIKEQIKWLENRYRDMNCPILALCI